MTSKKVTIRWILWCLLHGVIVHRACEAAVFENDLHGHLLSGYHAAHRPRSAHSQVVEVSVDFELLKITSLSETLEVLRVVGVFMARWRDDMLIWEPTEFGNITSVVLPPTKIWLPDFGISNAADGFYHYSFTHDFRVRVSHTGHVRWSFGGELSTTCDLDVTYYPFDIQKCNLIVENWAYNGNEVMLSSQRDVIALQNYREHGVWDLVNTSASHRVIYYSSGPEPYAEVTFTIFIKRKFLFFLLNLVGPCALLVIVAVSVFWLPADCGEKVSLGVTVLLGFSVFQIVLAEQVPKSSDSVPIMSKLVVGVMLISFLSILTSVPVLRLHHYSASYRLPRCLRVFFFRVVASVLCMCSSVPDVRSSDEPDPTDSSDIENSVSPHRSGKNAGLAMDRRVACRSYPLANDAYCEAYKFQETLNKVNATIQRKERDKLLVDEWRALANILDRFFFWISATGMVLVFVFLLTQRDTEY